MKTRIFNLIILDESGSMYRIKDQAVDGVNETIQSIRAAQKEHEEQEHFVTLVTFNDDAKTVFDCVSASEVSDLGSDSYQPNCCTALYDAMGMSLTSLKKNVTENDKVLVTIVTDGMENSSHEYDGQTIKKLVNDLKSQGWIFAYMGANQDVEKVAANISITNYMEFNATCEGTSEALSRERDSRSRLYSRMCRADFCAEDENLNFFKDEDDR